MDPQQAAMQAQVIQSELETQVKDLQVFQKEM